MSQKATNNSTAIQAGGDVHIGLSYPEVKEIIYDLFKQNFPSLVAEASAQARSNVDEYVKHLEDVIKRKFDEIDIDKFKDPNTQYLLNGTVVLAARKGKQIDLGLLTETLVARLGKNNTDMLDIVSEQALEIIPKLTAQHINILSNVQYIIHMSLRNLPDISYAEKFNKGINTLTSNIGDSVYSHVNYMSSLGVLIVNQFQGINPYEEIKRQHGYSIDSTSHKM